MHVRTHTGEILQSNGIEVHVRRYTGDKLCKCETCGTQLSSSTRIFVLLKNTSNVMNVGTR